MTDDRATSIAHEAGGTAVPFERAAQLESWLETHHGMRAELWLKLAKKSSVVASVTATEAIDTVLCYGWIDGQRRSFDEVYYLQRITPAGRGACGPSSRCARSRH